jgi:hypothetical protein
MLEQRREQSEEGNREDREGLHVDNLHLRSKPRPNDSQLPRRIASADPQCFLAYNQFTDANRNKTQVAGGTFCDNVVANGWLGAGWYRFTGAAGTQMSESSIPTNMCATHAPVTAERTDLIRPDDRIRSGQLHRAAPLGYCAGGAPPPPPPNLSMQALSRSGRSFLYSAGAVFIALA